MSCRSMPLASSASSARSGLVSCLSSRLSRLAMVREACARDLEAIAFYLNRGLCFQAFDRLYKAFQEFLQALFVARRTYPLCYNKWIQEQVIEWLSLPELYKELLPILSVRKIESAEVGEKAEALRTLLERWTCPEPQDHEARSGRREDCPPGSSG